MVERLGIEEIRRKVRETTEKDTIRDALRARNFSGTDTLRQSMNLIDFVLRVRKVQYEND